MCNLISIERGLPPLERQRQNNQNGGQIFKSHHLAEAYGTPRNRATLLHTKGSLSVVEKALQEGKGLLPPFKLTFWIKIGRLIPVAVQFLSPRSNSSEDEKHRREMQQFLFKRDDTQLVAT